MNKTERKDDWSARVWEIRGKQRGWKLERIRGCLALIKTENRPAEYVRPFATDLHTRNMMYHMLCREVTRENT